MNFHVIVDIRFDFCQKITQTRGGPIVHDNVKEGNLKTVGLIRRNLSSLVELTWNFVI